MKQLDHRAKILSSDFWMFEFHSFAFQVVSLIEWGGGSFLLLSSVNSLFSIQMGFSSFKSLFKS